MTNTELIELFSKIVNDANNFASVHVKISENNTDKSLKHLYCDFMEYINKISKNEQLTLLIPVLIETYFNKILPLLALPAQEIVSGDNHRIEAILKLCDELKNNEMKSIWESISSEFMKIMSSLDFTANSNLYEDILLNVHILIDAFSFWENYDFTGTEKYRDILQIRKGKTSSEKPVFINTITIFNSIHDITMAVEKSGIDSLIMFAAVRKSHKDTHDYFDEWVNGYNERKSNVMKYDHLTEDEYMKAEDEWSRLVYIVIKNGENIWIAAHKNRSSQTIMRDFYEYGRRTTYFPYQVLFMDRISIPETTTILSTTNKAYKLSSFLDEEQKMFIPILMYETKRRFFDEAAPMLNTVVLPQETMMQLTDGSISNNVLAVVEKSMPVTFQLKNYHIENIFSEEPATINLLRVLHITENDIADAPVLPTKETLLFEEFEKKLLSNIKKAYKVIIKRKLMEYQKQEEETLSIRRKEYFSFLQRKGMYASMLQNGNFIKYSYDVIDKQYGTTTNNMNRYYGQGVGANWYKTTEWIQVLFMDENKKIDKKYPVCIKVRPYDKKEILSFYGWEDNEELPFLIQHRDDILAYYGFNTVHRNVTTREYPGLIPICGMNFCMGKVSYQKLSKIWELSFTDKPRYQLDFSDKQRAAMETFIEMATQNGYKISKLYSVSGTTTIIAVDGST